MSLLERTDRVTICPYKGEANYFSIADGADRDDNAVWTYESAEGGGRRDRLASRLLSEPGRDCARLIPFSRLREKVSARVADEDRHRPHRALRASFSVNGRRDERHGQDHPRHRLDRRSRALRRRAPRRGRRAGHRARARPRARRQRSSSGSSRAAARRCSSRPTSPRSRKCAGSPKRCGDEIRRPRRPRQQRRNRHGRGGGASSARTASSCASPSIISPASF